MKAIRSVIGMAVVVAAVGHAVPAAAQSSPGAPPASGGRQSNRGSAPNAPPPSNGGLALPPGPHAFLVALDTTGGFTGWGRGRASIASDGVVRVARSGTGARADSRRRTAIAADHRRRVGEGGVAGRGGARRQRMLRSTGGRRAAAATTTTRCTT